MGDLGTCLSLLRATLSAVRQVNVLTANEISTRKPDEISSSCMAPYDRCLSAANPQLQSQVGDFTILQVHLDGMMVAMAYLQLRLKLQARRCCMQPVVAQAAQSRQLSQCPFLPWLIGSPEAQLLQGVGLDDLPCVCVGRVRCAGLQSCNLQRRTPQSSSGHCRGLRRVEDQGLPKFAGLNQRFLMIRSSHGAPACTHLHECMQQACKRAASTCGHTDEAESRSETYQIPNVCSFYDKPRQGPQPADSCGQTAEIAASNYQVPQAAAQVKRWRVADSDNHALMS